MRVTEKVGGNSLESVASERRDERKDLVLHVAYMYIYSKTPPYFSHSYEHCIM